MTYTLAARKASEPSIHKNGEELQSTFTKWFIIWKGEEPEKIIPLLFNNIDYDTVSNNHHVYQIIQTDGENISTCITIGEFDDIKAFRELASKIYNSLKAIKTIEL